MSKKNSCVVYCKNCNKYIEHKRGEKGKGKCIIYCEKCNNYVFHDPHLNSKNGINKNLNSYLKHSYSGVSDEYQNHSDSETDNFKVQKHSGCKPKKSKHDKCLPKKKKCYTSSESTTVCDDYCDECNNCNECNACNNCGECNICCFDNCDIPQNNCCCENGQDGAPGSQILTGNGIPNNLDGIDNDIYIDNLTTILYKKINGVWVQQTILRQQANSDLIFSESSASINGNRFVGQSITSNIINPNIQFFNVAYPVSQNLSVSQIAASVLNPTNSGIVTFTLWVSRLQSGSYMGPVATSLSVVVNVPELSSNYGVAISNTPVQLFAGDLIAIQQSTNQNFTYRGSSSIN